MSGIFGIVGALVGLVPEVGEVAAAPFEIASELTSMVPSATESLNTEFEGTYSKLQTEFANGISNSNRAMNVLSQLVRQDRNLLTLLGQMHARGTLKLDRIGMGSVGQQGFALWVYRTLLPVLYSRYTISNCQPDQEIPPHYYRVMCSSPAVGTLGMAGTATDFSLIGPAPTTGPGWPDPMPLSPCQFGSGTAWHCDFVGTPKELGTVLWGQLSPSCTYNTKDAGTAWHFGCNLGVDPQKSVLEPQQTSSQTWTFPTVTGSPLVPASAERGSVRITAGRPGPRSPLVLRLRGRAAAPAALRLGRARVFVDRLLHEPAGAGELVRGRSGLPLALSPATGGTRVFSARSRGGPGIVLRLRHGRRRSLWFDLRVRGALSLPSACSGTRPGVDLATDPIRLHTRLRIADGRRRPVVIPVRGEWHCRLNRYGAVKGLVLQRPRLRRPRRGGLAVAIRGPRRALPGRVATYRIRLSNPRRTTAFDVLVRADLPPDFRTRRARGTRRMGGHVVWRLARLRPGQSKSMRLRVRTHRSAAGRRCLFVSTQAVDTRGSRVRTCTRIPSSTPPATPAPGRRDPG